MTKPINRRKAFTVTLANYSVNGLANLITGWLIGHAPWLAWGPLDDIFMWGLKKFLHFAMENAIIGINTLIIEADVDADVSRLKAALDKAAKPVKPGEDANARDKEIKDAMRDLVSIGRSRL